MIRVQRATLVLALTCAVLVQGEDAPTWPRHRRQFPSQEWVPLTQPCPTCRPLADPADTRSNVNDIGLVPPRPPPTTRQVHGTGNFFGQNFQTQQQFPPQQRPFLDFNQFNQFPQTRHFFSPQQQAAFLPQTYLNNPQLLLNENPQLLPLVSNPQLLLGQKSQTPASNSVTSGEKNEANQIRFKQDQVKSSTKPPQNIRLEQEPLPPLTRLELPLNGPPGQFLQQQQFQQLQFQNRPEQQALLQINPSDPFLTPPPFRNANDSDIQIPGLDKEEIQLLYVPVETLRQRGHLQGHQVDDFSHNLNNNNNNRPFQQIIQTPTGHFITQAPSPSPQQPQFNSVPQVTPPPVLTQGLPLRDPPQQFVTERPQPPPTTEQVITIQPRPVSTVRQQQQTQGDSLRFTSRPSTRPSSPTTSQTRGTTTFLTNEHLTKVTEALLNEVTPPLPQTTLPPPTQEEPEQQFSQQEQAFQQQQQQQQTFHQNQKHQQTFQNQQQAFRNQQQNFPSLQQTFQNQPQTFQNQQQTFPQPPNFLPPQQDIFSRLKSPLPHSQQSFQQNLPSLPQGAFPQLQNLPPPPQEAFQNIQNLPPPPQETFQQPPTAFQQLQNLPPPPQQTFPQLPKLPEPETQLPQAPRHRFTPTPPQPELVTEITPTTTTLQPHQPPLSIYMASHSANVKVTDVLRALKGAETIAVLDSFGPESPKVFVGPANLNPPRGFGKFELPYLSNLEHNRVERRINSPFFVAPLNFNPPQGYSKIPFPAPHVGSVVVSTEMGDRSASTFQPSSTTETPASEQAHADPEVVTTVLPDTTTYRSRGRRPSTYRNSRKPVSSRQRVTIRPSEEETTPPITENQVSPQDFLREPQEDRRKATFPRRQRVKTTTEAIQETIATEPPQQVNNFVPQEVSANSFVREEAPTNSFGQENTGNFIREEGPVNSFGHHDPPTRTFAPQEATINSPATQDTFEIPQPPAQRLVEPVHPPFDFRRPQPHSDLHQLPSPPRTRNQLRRPQFSDSEFNPPPPPPPSFEFRPPQLPSADFHNPQVQTVSEPAFTSFQQPSVEQPRFPQFPQPSQDPFGQFGIPAQQVEQQPDVPVIENNGDSGVHQINQDNQVLTTTQPISTTQFLETTQSYTEDNFRHQTESPRRGKSTTSTTVASTTEEKEAAEFEEIEKQVDVPRKSSRFSYPNVPGVKSYPNPGSVKVKSHVRSRPRYSTPATSTTAEGEEEHHVPVEVSATGEDATSSPTTETSKTTSKYQSHFNRVRKPLRPSTTARSETTPAPTTRSYTVRPLRRSTLRTSISTKRIRKPTTPSSLDTEEEEVPEQTFAKKTRPTFTAPSAVSNEVYDEQTVPIAPKPKSRKPYFHQRQKNVEVIEDSATSPSPSTKTYQERKDEVSEDLKAVDGSNFGTSEPSAPSAPQGEEHVSTEAPSGPSAPSAPEEEEEKKGANEDRKKAKYSELSKKPRRRLRVRVQKRPHDNFETAESQNHGAVSNQLLNQPTSTPDIYRFSQGGDFEFDNVGKFIGTQHKGHVRNITAAILENTSTFSSPGTDIEVQKVTIASEPTTNVPETSEVTDKAIQEQAVTVIESSEEKDGTVEVTTYKHETTRLEPETVTTESVESTTSSEEIYTTVPIEASSSTSTTTTTTTNPPPSSEEFEPTKKQPKVLRTSTTTQVSHETEICYKGKCIKTNSDNPDQALKQLVEAANLEEMAKAKS